MKTLTLISAVFMIGLLSGCVDMEKAESKNATNQKYDDCVAAAIKAKTDQADCQKYLK
jgi:hypothetical protein